MYRISLLICGLCFFCTLASAQFSITGIVTNDRGEELEGAVVYLEGAEGQATTSDYSGRYLLENVREGDVTLMTTFLGYDKYVQQLTVAEDMLIDIVMANANFQLDKIEVVANKLTEQAPFSYTQMEKEEVDLKNLGQDIPFLLEHTPSMVVTSDAGAGIGYTGMRIRGSDATRINVTINGIPLNDSESHGVFWVNMPDFGSSVDKVQIQRGVGPSTNGSAAFGGSVGFNTNYLSQNAHFDADLTYGSFDTRKLSLMLTTGLMNGKYLIEGRYSQIESEGFIDRASSNLDSWYFSVGKVGERHSLKFNIFSGDERTYQAWNGVPEAKLYGTTEDLLEHYFRNSNGDYNTVADSINLFDSGRSYNAYTYENQVDDYGQDHYQLIYALQPTDKVKINLTGHYTKGKGFFEQFLFQSDLCDYINCSQVMSSNTVDNLVRRRWLDNHFFGSIANAEFTLSDKLKLTVGGSGSMYLGDHFGEIVDALTDSILRAEIVTLDDNEYYRSDATKVELNSYVKGDYKITDKLSLFGDLQFRNISYETEGTDSDQSAISIDTSYNFINPKVGLSYILSPTQMVYASYANASREPIRSDFLDAVGVAIPSPENLHDIEVGYRGALSSSLSLEANAYFMLYDDQLVLTGALNDVGAAVRTNVDKSSRIGLELAAKYNFSEYLSWKPNLTLSRNKINDFTSELEGIFVENPDIAFSPSIIAGSNLTYQLFDGFDVTLLSKYVGKQFLDNTSNEDRKLNPYLVNDILLTYRLESEILEGIEFRLLVNNVLDNKFESNGYTYSYFWNELITETYLYPQAGINFLLSASVRF